MEIKKVENLVGSLHDRTKFVIVIKNLKQALNHGLVLKQVHKINELNHNAW